MKLSDSAKGPLEALAGVPQVAHDEAVLPAALHRPRTTEVGGRGRSVVYSPKSERRGIVNRKHFKRNIQMPKFMRSHDDAGETASVLDDGHTVHLVAKAQRSKDGEQQRKKTKHNGQKTEKKKVSITFSRRLLTTQAPPT